MSRTAALTVDDHESTIDVTGPAGRIEIDTHEGHMDLRRLAGRLAVDTHDGDLIVEELEGGFRFEAHDGSASVSSAALGTPVFADTHDGDVPLTLPAGTGFDLNTDFDDDVNVFSDFDLSAIRRGGEDDDVNYWGAVDGGGPVIHLESHDGDFTLRSR